VYFSTCTTAAGGAAAAANGSVLTHYYVMRRPSKSQWWKLLPGSVVGQAGNTVKAVAVAGYVAAVAV
jgi:hypothetical protein